MINSLLGCYKQILTAFTRAMVKTMTPMVLPDRSILRSGDHFGSRSFNHGTRSSQYLYTTITAISVISVNCFIVSTIHLKIQYRTYNFKL